MCMLLFVYHLIIAPSEDSIKELLIIDLKGCLIYQEKDIFKVL